MRRFTELFLQLEQTANAQRKAALLRDYFAAVGPRDGAWAMYFLMRRKLRRLVTTRQLREWACRAAGIPDWLFEESYAAVGDVAETASLLLPGPAHPREFALHEVAEMVTAAGSSGGVSPDGLESIWEQLAGDQRFVFNKLVTGSLRMAVSETVVVRGLAEYSELPESVIAHRLSGEWDPGPGFYEALLADVGEETERARPYPFCRAEPLTAAVESLGDVREWQIEWQWDGIRAQLIRRGGESFLWSRRDEPLLERFPELEGPSVLLPDGSVIDGEIVGYRSGAVLPRGELKRRLGRRKAGKRCLAEVPVLFVAFDLLELGGADLREHSLRERREQLAELLREVGPASSLPIPYRNGTRPISTDWNGSHGACPIVLSPTAEAADWGECESLRSAARTYRARGLILKPRRSPYSAREERGMWVTWKSPPHCVRAVLLYVQRGEGARDAAEYTFALWDERELVPFARFRWQPVGEMARRINEFIDGNIIERFGPVRMLTPELVFEVAFDDVQPSGRHKCGLAVGGPHVTEWRRDLTPFEADSLESVRQLLSHDG